MRRDWRFGGACVSKQRGKPGRRAKNAAKKAIAPGTLVPQPHGGALRYGSTRPGPGRPRSLVRAIRKLPPELQLPFLEAILREGTDTAECIRAAEALGRSRGSFERGPALTQ